MCVTDFWSVDYFFWSEIGPRFTRDVTAIFDPFRQDVFLLTRKYLAKSVSLRFQWYHPFPGLFPTLTFWLRISCFPSKYSNPNVLDALFRIQGSGYSSSSYPSFPNFLFASRTSSGSSWWWVSDTKCLSSAGSIWSAWCVKLVIQAILKWWWFSLQACATNSTLTNSISTIFC